MADMFPNSPDRETVRQWGYLAGLWHDLGKFQHTFQDKLYGEQIHVEHAGAGAYLAKQLFEQQQTPETHYYPLSAAIAGHHSGLPNFLNQNEGKSTPLVRRLKNNQDLTLDWDKDTENTLTGFLLPKLPSWLRGKSMQEDGTSLGFFTRFLFSALVDADSLVTEALEHDTRDYNYTSIPALSLTLNSKLDNLTTENSDPRKKEINKDRRRILKACQQSAEQSSNTFIINAPTGGGKTLSGLSFALKHAAYNKQSRIIILAPYTTIIEQTADECRKFLGEKNVIEHHSNIDDFSGQETPNSKHRNKLLAAENWDAPIIVSTNVQFFESLFANKRGRCRKLHNIANSTIILDEAQCLPRHLLNATLLVLHELKDNYNCSIVLSTATQPAFQFRKKFPFGFHQPISLLPEKLVQELHQKLTKQRVSVTWDIHAPKDSIAAAKILQQSPASQKLIVVNTRKEAAEIFDQQPTSDSIFHLSTNLCPAHRKEQLALIKQRLESNAPCTVVSTQLIECGVDHSYAHVIRAMAGLDSLAQSAGRCNRHGEIKGGGTFTVYTPEHQPPGFITNCSVITKNLIGKTPPPYLADLELYDDYFRSIYNSGAGLDTNNVLSSCSEKNLEEVAQRYTMIDDYKPYSIIIPYSDTGEQRLQNARETIQFQQPLRREQLRALQPYTINLSSGDFETIKHYTEPLLDEGLSHFIHPGSLQQIYDKNLGLKLHSEIEPKEGYYV